MGESDRPSRELYTIYTGEVYGVASSLSHDADPAESTTSVEAEGTARQRQLQKQQQPEQNDESMDTLRLALYEYSEAEGFTDDEILDVLEVCTPPHSVTL